MLDSWGRFEYEVAVLRRWDYELWPGLADSSSRYRQAGEHFGDVGVDHLLVCRRGDRYPVVPVFEFSAGR